MAGHSRRISALLACIFSLLCVTHFVDAQNIGTVRLREEHPIFPDYAVFEPNSKQYVKVICQTGEHPPPAKPTIEIVYPLVKAQAGETLIISAVLPCYDNRNGYFVQVITQQDRVGITQLSNYQNLVETINAEGAFQVLSLFSGCGGDPECIINQFAEPYRQFTKRYPDSNRIAKAAEISARYYKEIAQNFQILADNPATLRNFHSRYSTYSPETLRAKAKEYSALRAEMNALELKIYGKRKPEQTTVQTPTPQSTPTQQTASPPQTAQTSPQSQNTILLYLIVISLAVGIIWYAINTSALAINRRQGIIAISTTALTAVLAFYGYQALGTGFVVLTILIAGLPWSLLFRRWHNPVKYRKRDESLDFLCTVVSIVPPLILLYILSRGFSTHVAYSIVFAVSSLLNWCLDFNRTNALRAEDAATEDAQRKQNLIAGVVDFAAPLSRFLSRYHPDIYPPPVNRCMAMAISTYAKLLSNHERANGKTPPPLSDFDLLRSYRTPFSATSFPSTWGSQETAHFYASFMEMVAMLAFTADLGLEVNTRYALELTAVFESHNIEVQKKVEAQLPPFVRERSKRVEDWLIDRKDLTPEQKIGWIDEQLTALIPEYVAQNSTVIGTPPDGLPVAYDSLESRYRHTFLIGSSGSGKSTTITNLVVQDIHKGYGVIVMSPDENLMHRIVPHILEHRLDDVIYVDPGDTTSPIIGFNPLFFDASSDTRDYDRLKRWKAAENYAVLMRTLNIDTEPTKNLLNHTMYALTGRPNTTLNDLRRLIDPKERALHVEIASDSRVDTITREFWRDYATEGANAMVYRNLSSRIVPLLRPPLFDIFSTQSLSFHRELNEHARIVLIDLSNMGSRDSQEAKIASQLLIATIHQTMLRRDKMKEADYIPYFMYIDEFQQYADTNEFWDRLKTPVF